MKKISAFLMHAALLAALSFGASMTAAAECKGQCPREAAACCKAENCCKDGKCTKGSECCKQGQCNSACCKKQ